MDTNVLLMSIPKNSPYRKIFDELIDGGYEMVISNEILSEYTEVIERKANDLVAKNIAEFLTNSRNVHRIEVFYKWNLINVDPDDNKFVDCAIAGNVKFIVSNDAHFKALKNIPFPPVEVIHIDDFLNALNDS